MIIFALSNSGIDSEYSLPSPPSFSFGVCFTLPLQLTTAKLSPPLLKLQNTLQCFRLSLTFRAFPCSRLHNVHSYPSSIWSILHSPSTSVLRLKRLGTVTRKDPLLYNNKSYLDLPAASSAASAAHKLMESWLTFSLKAVLSLSPFKIRKNCFEHPASPLLQECIFGNLPGSTEINPRDHVKEIATARSDWNRIRHIASYEYAVSNLMNSNVYPEPKQYIPFLKRLHDCTYNEVFEWKHTYLFNITDQEESPPHKEKDPGSFTLPSFINDNCFKKLLVDLGASVSVMPYSTYVNLGRGTLTKTYMTIELADRSIKPPKGIVENVLVKIKKFTFLVDFVVLDIPEDKDVPLILGRPFLSTAYAKIDVFKRKISLRVGNEKIVFESIKPASSIIKRVYMLSLRERMDLDLESRLMGETLILNRSFDPLYGDYKELNDLNTPIELRRNQGVLLEPTTKNGEVDYEPLVNTKTRCKTHAERSYDCPSLPKELKLTFSCKIRYRRVTADLFPFLSVNTMTQNFYNSVIKDKKNRNEKIVGTLINIPVFVGNFSIFSDFVIIEGIHQRSGLKDVILGMPFFNEFVSRQTMMERFAKTDDCELAAKE
ncbi:zf-CCHC domain-containing protein [Tanacetum coccineum]